MSAILLVGYRSQAVQAVLKMGYDCYVWDPNRLSAITNEKIAGHFRYPFHKDTLSSEMLHALNALSFSTIIATKEKAVPFTALINASLKQSGLSFEQALTCHDKLLMKQKAALCGIPITDYQLIDGKTNSEALIKQFGLPLVLKERSNSGRRGQVIANNAETLAKSLRPNMIAERYIHGKEYSVESFVLNGRIVFSNITEYYRNTFCNIVPAALDQPLETQLLALNERVMRAFAMEKGMTHAEYYLTHDGFLLGEIAIRPPGGYLMDLMELSYGIDPWHLYLKAELGESVQVSLQPKRYSAVWVIHPGEGIVQNIDGVDWLSQQKSVSQIKLKCKAGDILTKRLGVGCDYGRIILVGDTYQELVATIRQIPHKFTISLQALQV